MNKSKQKIGELFKEINQYNNLLNQHEEKDIKKHIIYIKIQLEKELEGYKI